MKLPQECHSIEELRQNIDEKIDFVEAKRQLLELFSE